MVEFKVSKSAPDARGRAQPHESLASNFFGSVHDQRGVSQSNRIELHPILKTEWL